VPFQNQKFAPSKNPYRVHPTPSVLRPANFELALMPVHNILLLISQMDRWTDCIIIPIADHTVCCTIG